MLVQLLLCGAGLVVLTIAADQLVLGSSRLALVLRVNPVVIGVLIIGLGTSAPEFLVSGVAAARGDAGIAVGNLAGSNILNVTFILGVAALITPVTVRSSVVRREVPLAVGASAVFAVSAWWGLTPLTAAILAVLLVGAVAMLLRWSYVDRTVELAVGPPTAAVSGPPRRTWLDALRALLGLAGVLGGAQLLVTNASAVAQRFGVPQVVIGFTLVAVGTSLPELVTSIQAQRRGEVDLVVGNLFGSNLFNSLVGGAVVGFAAGRGDSVVATATLAALTIFTGLLAWALLRRGLRLGRGEAVLLIAVYLLTWPLLISS